MFQEELSENIYAQLQQILLYARSCDFAQTLQPDDHHANTVETKSNC